MHLLLSICWMCKQPTVCSAYLVFVLVKVECGHTLYVTRCTHFLKRTKGNIKRDELIHKHS